MLLWPIEYYIRINGRIPVAEWLGGRELDKNSKAVILAKIEKLGECGLELLGTEMMTPIKNKDRDLYELVSQKQRIAVYFDRKRATFILLHGWKKQKQRQPQDIEQARRLLREYLSRQGG